MIRVVSIDTSSKENVGLNVISALIYVECQHIVSFSETF